MTKNHSILNKYSFSFILLISSIVGIFFIQLFWLKKYAEENENKLLEQLFFLEYISSLEINNLNNPVSDTPLKNFTNSMFTQSGHGQFSSGEFESFEIIQPVDSLLASKNYKFDSIIDTMHFLVPPLDSLKNDATFLTHKYKKIDSLFYVRIQNNPQLNFNIQLKRFNKNQKDLIAQQKHIRTDIFGNFLAIDISDSKIFLSNLPYVLIYSLGCFLLLFSSSFYIFKIYYKDRKIWQLKNDFINSMSHELKTPLTANSFALEALENIDEINIQETKEYLDIIRKENKRLILLVKTILDTQQLMYHNTTLNMSVVNLHQLLVEIIHSFQPRIDSKQGKIDLNLKASSPITETDQLHLTNIISNLISNALTYNTGHPIIQITTKNQDNHLYMSIEDNGIGIDKKYHKKIFQQYFRIEEGKKHNDTGIGIGLFYVKETLKKMNASISIEEKKDTSSTGTSFLIKLPHHVNV